MILAHLSDLHLGFRAYGRTRRGRNVRESDVATAFQRAVQELLRIRPEVVVVAGDLLDHPRPPPSAIVTLGRGLETLREALPDATVLLAAGPRDVPASGAEPGVLATFDTLPGVEAVTSTARAVLLRERGLRVLVVPHPVLARPPLPAVRPDPRVRWNVLVAPVAVAAPLRERGPGADGRAAPLLDPAEWDYVALGGRHRASAVRPNVRFSGSLERIGPEPWREAAEEKGFLTWDLERGEARFHPLRGRPVVSLAPLRFDPRDAGLGERRIREVLSEVPGGLDDKLVRLPVASLSPDALAGLDPRVLAPFRRRALHLQVEVDPDPGDGGRTPSPESAEGGARTGITALLVRRSRDRAVLREAREAGEPGEGVLEPAELLRRLVGAAEAEAPGAAGPTPPASDGGSGAAPDTLPDEEVARLEARLSELRAEAAEVEGEVEVSTMGWLRERQDAETRLQAYRDRARELKVRLGQLDAAGPEAPCPTCGRLLDEHHAEVVEELREEWEAVVRDGQWWKRRREQLELKPERLQEAELRQMRLHASLEETLERLERARARASSRRATKARSGAAGPAPPAAPATERPPSLRAAPLLERAGARLSRITGGRFLGLLPWDGSGPLRVAGPEASGEPTEEEDRAAVRAALRVAAAESGGPAAGGGASRGRLLLPLEDVRGMGADDRLRLLGLLAALLPRIGRIAIETDGLEVERMPELVERVIEVRERSERGERPTLHAWRPGPAVLRIEQGARTPR